MLAPIMVGLVLALLMSIGLDAVFVCFVFLAMLREGLTKQPSSSSLNCLLDICKLLLIAEKITFLALLQQLWLS